MPFSGFRKVAPNSMLARVFLAFLSTAGIFYVNILPALVDGLITALGFSNQQAGSVASANLYGAALGALLIVFLIRKLNWQLMALLLLAGLISIDLASMFVTQPDTMVALRFADGFIGGMLVGTGFSVIARTEGPDRTFGVLLFVQFGLGGLGVMMLPGLVDQFGTRALFLALIAFSTVTLCMLPFLPDYKVDAAEAAARKALHGKIRTVPLVMTLIAIFLFQASNNALYAYIIGLGEFFGQQGAMITTTLGVAAWLGLAGAGLVVLISDRFGYLKTLVAGLVVTITRHLGSSAQRHRLDLDRRQLPDRHHLGLHDFLPARPGIAIRHGRPDGRDGRLRVEDGPGLRSGAGGDDHRRVQLCIDHLGGGGGLARLPVGRALPCPRTGPAPSLTRP